jgi:predicted site-specific integrase-resolvase
MPEPAWVPLTCILHGLDEIARYLHVSRRTARRWIQDGLPAMQTPADTWITTASLIDLWILEVARYQREQEKLKQGDTPIEG